MKNVSFALYLPTYSKNKHFPFFSSHVAGKIVEKGIKTNISTFLSTPTHPSAPPTYLN